jgi:Family of unknown function (DUF6153)
MVAALAGLFAMHGLSDHGMGGPDALATVGGSAMTHDAGAMTVAGHGSGSAAEPSDRLPIEDHHDMGLVGLCLAVLVAVLLIGWSVWRRGLRPLRAWLPHWPPTGMTLLRARPLRPPDLLALSIQRC